MSHQPAGTIVALGGGAAVVGSFLPWARVQTIFGTITASGIDGRGDGWITIVVGGLLILVGWRLRTSGIGAGETVMAMIAAAAIVGVAVYDGANIERVASEISTEIIAGFGTGVGIYIAGVGGAVAGIAALTGGKSTRIRVDPT